MDTETDTGTPAVKFPTPNDISKAARKAFPKKPVAKKAAKPKAKPAKKVAKAKKAKKSAKKARKVTKTKRKPGKPKVKPAAVARSERLDLRLTKAEKGKIAAKATKLRRTVTSIVIEAIEKIK